MNRLRPRNDAGFGLPEFVVSMAMSGILLLALGTTFAGSLTSSSKNSTRISDTADLRLAMDTVARRLRLAVRPAPGAAAFEVAGPRTVRFFAAMDKPGVDAEQPPTLVEYAVTPTCLEERRTTPSGTTEATWSWTVGATTTTTCLVRGAVNADGAALFTYYAGIALTAPVLGTPTTSVATADLGSIQGVQATLAVQKSATSNVPASRASTRVALVNLLPIT